jgi:hypothetical protein
MPGPAATRSPGDPATGILSAEYPDLDLTVTFENDRVVMIETTSANARTSAGFGPGTDMAAVRAVPRFGEDPCSGGYGAGGFAERARFWTVFVPGADDSTVARVLIYDTESAITC